MKKKEEKSIVIKGYKGYDSNFKCRDFQYEIGKEYKEEKAEICENGFHFCENPLDIFNYYDAATSKFTEVEGSGIVSKKKEDSDTKVSVSNIKIGAELSLHSIIERGVKFIFEKTTLNKENTNTKEKLQASNSGDSGAASNSGHRGAAFNIAYYGSSETNAKDSIAVSLGYSGKVKGNLGAWLVVSERNNNEEILNIVSIKVDGEIVKANTWYKLVNNKLVEQ